MQELPCASFLHHTFKRCVVSGVGCVGYYQVISPASRKNVDTAKMLWRYLCTKWQHQFIHGWLVMVISLRKNKRDLIEAGTIATICLTTKVDQKIFLPHSCDENICQLYRNTCTVSRGVFVGWLRYRYHESWFGSSKASHRHLSLQVQIYNEWTNFNEGQTVRKYGRLGQTTRCSFSNLLLCLLEIELNILLRKTVSGSGWITEIEFLVRHSNHWPF